MADQGPVRTFLGGLTGRGDSVRPPQLRTDDHRSSSSLELFFDLAFVLVGA